MLAGGYENICVVGDDDQCIYRFRGANIENILNFEKQYPGARTIRLEQNYRSTQNILDAANAVIRNNTGRKGKTLWTDNGAGEAVTVKTSFNEGDEANYVVGADPDAATDRGADWKDNAVLYRMNAQSNALEYAFKRNGMPYKIVGGTKFFDRAEVKDMLAYLCVINNPAGRPAAAADHQRTRPGHRRDHHGQGRRPLAREQGACRCMEILRKRGPIPGAEISCWQAARSLRDLIDGLRRARRRTGPAGVL